MSSVPMGKINKTAVIFLIVGLTAGYGASFLYNPQAAQLSQQNSNLNSELNAVTYERDSLQKQVSLYGDLAARSGIQIAAMGYHYHPPDYRIQERNKMITTYVTLRNTDNKTMCATLSYNIARITSNSTGGDIRHQDEVCVPPNTDRFSFLREFRDLVAIQNDAPQVEISLIRVREG